MQFINIISGDIEEGRTGEFIAWLEENEEALAAAHPEGTKYLGTYFAVVGGPRGGGSVYTLVGMDSYGSMDALAEAGGEYYRLVDEVVHFFDQGNNSNGVRMVLKKATEATTYGPG